MLFDAVTIDGAMTPGQALRRLAQHGYWIDPAQGEARAWLDEYVARIRGAAKRTKKQPDDLAEYGFAAAAQRLGRDAGSGRVAIRRQVGPTIFWYARPVGYVLDHLTNARPEDGTVSLALQLHEYTSDPASQVTELDGATLDEFNGVVLNGQHPVAVSDTVQSMSTDRTGRSSGVIDSSGQRRRRGAKRQAIRAHPLLEAPKTVLVGRPFELAVGLTDTPAPGVKTKGAITLPVKAGERSITLDIQLIADGFDLAGNWARALKVSVANPTDARVTFDLTPLPQDEAVRTTSLIVHYVLDGVVRGSASRHVVVEQEAGVAGKPDPRGTSWQDAEPPTPALVLSHVDEPPDIEVDIAKPDGRAAKGRYKCVMRNAHGVPVPDRPLDIDLGDDAKTFAKSLMDQVWGWSSEPVVDQLLAGVGATVAAQLPPEFWTLLNGVAKKVTNRPVTLQFNSAEPYVPWELAYVEALLDPKRPPFLGAQVAMGRWILGDSAVASPPRQTLSVNAMAVLAGLYVKKQSGLNPLPAAIDEAREITKTYRAMPAVALECTPANLQSLLTASVTHELQRIGGVQAVHFAGHGYVDPTKPGDSALYLSNGAPLTPMFFRNTKLGRDHGPFIFLNACMVGTGGEILGDYGGFPGNCLAGGFSGLLAPLWAVYDDAAKYFAVEFYKRALGESGGQSVAEIIRDLRANYGGEAPNSTYLAYAYYGSPTLKLTRSS